MSSMAALPLATRPAELPAPGLGRGGEEALLERLDADELLELLAGLDEARVAEVELGLGRLQRLGEHAAQRELVPPVRGRPLVARADGDRRDARLAQLADGVHELVERRRGLVDARLLEQVLVVPEALDAEGERHAVRACRRPATG